jgi:hypothetical protein
MQTRRRVDPRPTQEVRRANVENNSEGGGDADQSPPTATVSVTDSGPPSAAKIKRQINAGVGCAELFETRNALDPHSPDIPTINANLREIGCYSSSTRTK